MGIPYKFLNKVSVEQGHVVAHFRKGWLLVNDKVTQSEKGCRELFMLASQPESEWGVASTSKDEIRRGFGAIHDYKASHGIRFDFDTIE